MKAARKENWLHEGGRERVADEIYLLFIQMASSRIYVFRDIALFKLAYFHRTPVGY